MARASHRKTVKTSATLKSIIQSTGSTVTLKTAFVAAVKAAYTAGKMDGLRLDRIVPAVAGAVRARKGTLQLPQDDRSLEAAVDVALTYLVDRGQITLPQGELANVA